MGYIGPEELQVVTLRVYIPKIMSLSLVYGLLPEQANTPVSVSAFGVVITKFPDGNKYLELPISPETTHTYKT